MPAVLFLAPSHGSCCPQVFVSRASCACMENGSQSPGYSGLTTRSGSQAGSLRLAGYCKGSCITSLSAGHGACWFWVRRSSQSKQYTVQCPSLSPGVLDRLMGLVRSWQSGAAWCPGLSDMSALGNVEMAWPGSCVVQMW